MNLHTIIAVTICATLFIVYLLMCGFLLQLKECESSLGSYRESCTVLEKGKQAVLDLLQEDAH